MQKNKIHIFFHVATINDYQLILNEQLKTISKSGILKDSELSIGVVGDHKINTNLTSNIHYFGDIDRYEYPTLHLMWEWCKKNENAHVLYIHTKGVSSPKKEYLKHLWRYEMMANVRNWKKCIKYLKLGYSMVAVGTKWTTNKGGESFWAGTFFWSNANFISQLPDPLIIPEQFENSRWYSELWTSTNDVPYTIFEIEKTLYEKLLYKLRFYNYRIKNKVLSKFLSANN